MKLWNVWNRKARFSLFSYPYYLTFFVDDIYLISIILFKYLQKTLVTNDRRGSYQCGSYRKITKNVSSECKDYMTQRNKNEYQEAAVKFLLLAIGQKYWFPECGVYRNDRKSEQCNMENENLNSNDEWRRSSSSTMATSFGPWIICWYETVFLFVSPHLLTTVVFLAEQSRIRSSISGVSIVALVTGLRCNRVERRPNESSASAAVEAGWLASSTPDLTIFSLSLSFWFRYLDRIARSRVINASDRKNGVNRWRTYQDNHTKTNMRRSFILVFCLLVILSFYGKHLCFESRLCLGRNGFMRLLSIVCLSFRPTFCYYFLTFHDLTTRDYRK